MSYYSAASYATLIVTQLSRERWMVILANFVAFKAITYLIKVSEFLSGAAWINLNLSISSILLDMDIASEIV